MGSFSRPHAKSLRRSPETLGARSGHSRSAIALKVSQKNNGTELCLLFLMETNGNLKNGPSNLWLTFSVQSAVYISWRQGSRWRGMWHMALHEDSIASATCPAS